MNYPDLNTILIETTREKAFELSSEDKIGNVLLKSADLLAALNKENSNIEKLSQSMRSLEKERQLIYGNDKHRDKMLRKLIYALSESVESTIGWIVERRKNMESQRMIKKEMNDFDDLMNVSVVGESNINADPPPRIKVEISDTHVGTPSISESTEKDYSNVKEELPTEEYSDHLMSVSEVGECSESAEVKTMEVMMKRGIKSELSESDATNDDNRLGEVSDHELDSESTDSDEDSDDDEEMWSDEESDDDDIVENSDGTEKERRRDSMNKNQQERSKCDQCDRSFTRIFYLKTHKLSHLDTTEKRKPFKCDECGTRFNELKRLKNHKNEHLSNDDPRKKKYKCDECDKVYYSFYAFRYHERKHLEADVVEYPFKCKQCTRRFKDEAQREWHEKTHLRIAEKKYACDQCDKRYRTPNDLAKHKNGHLADDDPRKKKYPCNKCEKILNTSHSLYMHKKLHSDTLEVRLPYKCDHCDRRFSQKGAMERHAAKSHLGVTFDCDECDKSYPYATSLKLHKKKHHNDNVEDSHPFVCSECNMRFSQSTDLKTHQRSHLPADDPRKFKFECDECGQKLASKATLKEHKRRHLDDTDPAQAELRRPFKCDQCPKRFACKGDLRKHTDVYKVHSTLLPISTTTLPPLLGKGLPTHMLVWLYVMGSVCVFTLIIVPLIIVAWIVWFMPDEQSPRDGAQPASAAAAAAASSSVAAHLTPTCASQLLDTAGLARVHAPAEVAKQSNEQ